eukprot:TRINITY_DN2495_c0_g2_i13.p1 TRINITY_DN2495_c0_g2~~TRINITY_DN2495_c0_g2_i13.p1  ORF type:complete len:113 (-),score=36.29 TRINITY_DN2495_c0_g2_i13:152-466(-)
MIRRPPRSTHCISSAASDVYKRQILGSVKRKIRRHIRKPKKAAVRRVPRKRKTQDQINALTRELEEGEEFDKERLKEIAEKTGLNASQVYKWYWEHRRKTSLDM